MADYYKPDFASDSNSPFARDASGKLVRRGFWLDMGDRSLVLAMTVGIGAGIPNNQKKLHLSDIERSHLIDEICIQEILPPDR